MRSDIDNWLIPVACPQCGQQIEKTLAWLENHRDLACPSGGAEFGVNSESFRAIREQILKFEKNIKGRLGE